MNAERGRCTQLPVQNAAKRRKSLSNPLRVDLCTAGNATRSAGDTDLSKEVIDTDMNANREANEPYSTDV